MFEFLNDVPRRTPSPQGTTRFNSFGSGRRSHPRSGQSLSFEGLPPTQVGIAKRRVAEIETQKGKPAAEIPEIAISEYIRLVSESLRKRSRSTYNVNRSRRLRCKQVCGQVFSGDRTSILVQVSRVFHIVSRHCASSERKGAK